MNSIVDKDIKKDSLALGLDNRFSRKPRWMSGMAVHVLQSETARYQQEQAKKALTTIYGKPPRHI